MKKSLAQQFKQYAQQAGGSHKTRHDRTVMMNRFTEHLQDLNIQIRSVDHLKAKHIQSYIDQRQENGISTRTLHNEMSMIRVVLREAGREKFASSEQLSNRELGLSGASRMGTKEAISDERYPQAYQAALAKDEGFAVALQLSRLMGLRSQEAVQCVQSLKTWSQLLNMGKTRLPVTFGTKGGRPRETMVLDKRAVQLAVIKAYEIAKERGGRLIDKPNLKQAMVYWRNTTTAIGLTGKNAPHSLRYAWAQDAIKHYLEQGFSKEEARALTSMDLGHGDGRGRYVERVYGLTEEEA